MTERGAYIDEVFSSLQGEGLYLGKVQLFIRFALCNLRCAFCDSPRALTRRKIARIEKRPHSHTFSKVRNPIPKEKLIQIANRFDKDNKYYHSISLTGGEPLCQADFLKSFLKDLKRKGKRIYLETNGTLPAELDKIIRYVDIVSMDVKLPSSSRQEIDFDDIEKFIKRAHKKELFVKMVITGATEMDDVMRACTTIAKIDGSIPLVLQPVSETKVFRKVPDMERLLLMARSSKAILSNVQVIPQMHRKMKIK